MSFDFADFAKSVVNESNLKAILTDTARNELMNWVDVKALPTVRDAADTFNAQLKKCAETETGWCKIRDGFFLPSIVSIGVWFLTQVAKYINEEASKEIAAKQSADQAQ